MMLRSENCHIENVGFYQQENKLKKWHRYADILVPLTTLPLLIFIALYLNDYINHQQSPSAYVQSKWKMVVLGILLLTVSLTVFIYICIRLNAVRGGRSKIRIPMFSSSKSNVFRFEFHSLDRWAKCYT